MPENYVSVQSDKGGVYIAEDVIAAMVSASVSGVEGVAGLSNTTGSELADLLGVKSISRGVKISTRGDTTVIDILMLVRYGYNVTETARKLQNAVAAQLEAVTGIKTQINVHVTGISFEKAEIKK